MRYGQLVMGPAGSGKVNNFNNLGPRTFIVSILTIIAVKLTNYDLLNVNYIYSRLIAPQLSGMQQMKAEPYTLLIWTRQLNISIMNQLLI